MASQSFSEVRKNRPFEISQLHYYHFSFLVAAKSSHLQLAGENHLVHSLSSLPCPSRHYGKHFNVQVLSHTPQLNLTHSNPTQLNSNFEFPPLYRTLKLSTSSSHPRIPHLTLKISSLSFVRSFIHHSFTPIPINPSFSFITNQYHYIPSIYSYPLHLSFITSQFQDTPAYT